MKSAVVFVALFGALVCAEADFYNQFPSAGGSSRNDKQCTKTNEYFERCASPCEETCTNYQNFFELKNKPECSLRNCVARCKCVSGYVRNLNGLCVPKTECKDQDLHQIRGAQQSFFHPEGYPSQSPYGPYPQEHYASHKAYPSAYPYDAANQYESYPYNSQYNQQYGNQYDANSFYNDYNKY
ncbi:hypothetical protein DMENIID0001_111000 [Sergentomyia squamirostris]